MIQKLNPDMNIGNRANAILLLKKINEIVEEINKKNSSENNWENIGSTVMENEISTLLEEKLNKSKVEEKVQDIEDTDTADNLDIEKPKKVKKRKIVLHKKSK